MHLGETCSPRVVTLADQVLVAPLGSFEQHGRHLPLLTDTLIISEIVRRSHERLADTACFLPTLWIGASEKHTGLSGTISAPAHGYADALCGILRSVMASGFQRVLLLCGHGGNVAPAREAALAARRSVEGEPPIIAVTDWWTLTGDRLWSTPGLTERRLYHSGEIETSMVLAIRPELVDMSEARGCRVPFDSAFHAPDMQRSSRVEVPRYTREISATGAFGSPELATAEKGNAILALAADELVAFVREFQSWSDVQPG